jgi:hypothetical protein
MQADKVREAKNALHDSSRMPPQGTVFYVDHATSDEQE